MPTNEDSGIGGRSNGRIALYVPKLQFAEGIN